MKVLAAVCATALLVGGCSNDPTSSAEYGALEQELDAAQQQIQELTAERDELAETVASQRSSGEVEIGDAVEPRGERLEAAQLLLGYFAGVDPEIVDPERYESWAGVVKLDSAVEAVNDPELTELYREHMGEGGFSPGSDELVLRLIELTISPILEDARTASPVALHHIPFDSVGVTGTATCSFSVAGTDPENPDGESGDLVTCTLEMSDPRVSGTETHDRFRYYDIGEDSMAWVAEEAIITNDEGTWRGVAQAGDDGTPVGEAHYVGDGAYEGLEFHYYLAHTVLADSAELRGWISDRGP